ncbi:MAG: hypothetical protein AAF648_16195, partial [Pseudomonadota bacterium]
PDFFFNTDGGWQGMRIIVLVDMVLGPLLTLVVFKAGKPGLRFDLATIAVIQTVCLAAGTFIVYQERPLALVYADGQFNSLAYDDFVANHIDPAVLDDFPGSTPKWLMVNMPEDPVVQSAIRRDLLDQEISTAMLVEHYAPFDAASPLVTEESTKMDELRRQDALKPALDDFVANKGFAAEELRYHPYAARFSYFYLAFNKADNAFVGLLPTLAPQ